jgi:2-oxoglutarate ferredoxin oxidoreductase subunit delta
MVMFRGLVSHIIFVTLWFKPTTRGYSGVKYWRKPLDADTVKSPKGKIYVIKEQCKGCGFCVEYCPRDVLELSQEFNKKGYHPPVAIREDDCVSCGLCELICPEFAIYAELVEEGGRREPAGKETPGKAKKADKKEKAEV